jgi:flagella basal body P-ring formation protein FlgA
MSYNEERSGMKTCFDKLRTNGKYLLPFIPSINSGQALSVSKAVRSVQQRWTRRVVVVFCLAFSVATARGNELTQEKAQAAVERHVLKHSPWKREQIEVMIRPFKPLPLPAGVSDLRVIAPGDKVAPGLHNFLLAAEGRGKDQVRTWVRAEIRLFEEVLVSLRPIGRDRAILPEDVRIERRDIGALGARPLSAKRQVAGKLAARNIGINEILTESVVAAPKVVERGNALTLIYETASLKIEAPGRALEDGRIGDVIPVKNPSSGKIVEGKIVDGRTVRVNW